MAAKQHAVRHQPRACARNNTKCALISPAAPSEIESIMMLIVSVLGPSGTYLNENEWHGTVHRASMKATFVHTCTCDRFATLPSFWADIFRC